MHISCQFSGDSGSVGRFGHGVLDYWSDGVMAQDSQKARIAFFWKLTWLRHVILANSYIGLHDS
jgi:hypothetical protein